jgi:hypothetical protein
MLEHEDVPLEELEELSANNQKVQIVCDCIRPHLACLPVSLQGDALAYLLADWLAEQCYVRAPKSVRDQRRNELLENHVDMVRELVRSRGAGALRPKRGHMIVFKMRDLFWKIAPATCQLICFLMLYVLLFLGFDHPLASVACLVVMYWLFKISEWPRPGTLPPRPSKTGAPRRIRAQTSVTTRT